MRLNPEKCTFRVRTRTFLAFYLTERVNEANLDKCEAVIRMVEPKTKKEFMKLNMMLTTLNMFISKLAQHALSFYKLFEKEAFFKWTP